MFVAEVRDLFPSRDLEERMRTVPLVVVYAKLHVVDM